MCADEMCQLRSTARIKNIMQNETQQLVDRLFKTGGHFGFQKSRRHPSVVQYLFGNKEGTDIIDLEKTAQSIEAAKAALANVARNGGDVIFVGTKDESQTIVREAALEAGASYVVNRWVGGTLTNFAEARKRLARLADLITQGETGELDRKYTKKERGVINHEMKKLTYNFGGVRKLERLPKMIVVVDARHNTIPVEEALKLNIPILAIAGTDNDVSKIQFPIVMNDSLVGAVKAVLGELATTYKTARAEYVPPVAIARAPREAGERRSFRDRAPRGGDRGDRPRRPFTARKEGEHPRAPRAQGGRPQAARAPKAQA